MKLIPLTKGKFTKVDDADFESLSQTKWCITAGYASCRCSGKIIYLHRLLCNTPKGVETDHINGDKLDNQRVNLRTCTHAQNARSQNKQVCNTSGYKGVVRLPYAHTKWEAKITVNKKCIHLGHFVEILDAARAYDVAARKYFGAFAKTNF